MVHSKAGIWVALLAWACLTASAVPRVAILVNDSALSTEADLLTVQLSLNSQVSLLEREQMSRLLREQGLSSWRSGNFTKLGEILGADGLLMLDSSTQRGKATISARLAAVKPGIVLEVVDFDLPLKNPEEWSKLVAQRFSPLLPKLATRVKDAIPISLLNVRSAVKSARGEALERELNFLLVRRLVHESEIFVLERQKLRALSEEKDLSPYDESAFWNGSYLLEATVDREGYAPERLTLAGRLTPFKGDPIEIEVAGPRSDPSALVSEFVSRVLAAIHQPGRPSPTWAPAAEANRYFEEATWALRWDMLPEALAAANSAWALGRHDEGCATGRVRAALKILQRNRASFSKSAMGNAIATGIGSWSAPTRAYRTNETSTFVVQVSREPDPNEIAMASQALIAFEEYSRTLPDTEPQADSPWCNLGTELLQSSSQVLRHFHFLPESQPPVAERLAELRSLSKSVAGWILKSPSVREVYFAANQFTNRPSGGPSWTPPESLRRLWMSAYAESTKTDILRCAADSAYLWSENASETLEVYRDLANSALFSWLAPRICVRDPENPPLAAWNATNPFLATNSPLWKAFALELESSTNFVARAAGMFCRVTAGQQGKEDMFTALFDSQMLRNNAAQLDVLVTSVDPLFKAGPPELETEYRRRLAEVRFNRQEQFLIQGQPCGFHEFLDLFPTQEYSREKALTLESLAGLYKSNLTFQAKSKTGAERQVWDEGIRNVWLLEISLEQALGKFHPTQQRPKPPSTSEQWALIMTNFLHLDPKALLPEEAPSGLPEPGGSARLEVTGHRICAGRLWLHLRGDFLQTKPHKIYGFASAAILDPAETSWHILPYRSPLPAGALGWLADYSENFFCLSNNVFFSDLALKNRKFDLATHRWEELQLPVARLTRFFAVHSRLYAVSDDAIVELAQDGRNMRFLASCRRRPALSLLDSLSSFGDVRLSPGPRDSLLAWIGNKVYRWNGKQWDEMADLAACLGSSGNDNQARRRAYGPVRRFLDVFGEETVFRSIDPSIRYLFVLPRGEEKPELAVYERSKAGFIPGWLPGRDATPKATWSWSDDDSLVQSPVAVFAGDLYFLLFRTRAAQKQSPAARDVAVAAELVCLKRGTPQPLRIPLEFVGSPAPTPPRLDQDFLVVTPAQLPWMTVLGNKLVIGQWNLRGVWILDPAELAPYCGSTH